MPVFLLFPADSGRPCCRLAPALHLLFRRFTSTIQVVRTCYSGGSRPSAQLSSRPSGPEPSAQLTTCRLQAQLSSDGLSSACYTDRTYQLVIVAYNRRLALVSSKPVTTDYPGRLNMIPNNKHDYFSAVLDKN